MKAKDHFWSSLAAGGALYSATGSSSALYGSIIGGFAIDADHIIDQLWSMRRGARLRRKRAGDETSVTKPKWITNLLRPRNLGFRRDQPIKPERL